MSEALSVEKLSYAVRSQWTYRSLEILHGLSFAVQEGESFGFVGHNGAGKTTTIKCVLNLLRPSQGAIRLFGVSSLETNARANVGYLAEQPYFYDYLTVGETLDLYATLAGIPRGERAAAVRRALDRVRVSARSKSPLRSLSKGLTQRVGMAQAIVARPKLLILDEPFSGLDPLGRREFRELLVELKGEGTTIFICSHILGDVEFLCDAVAIISHGAVKGSFAMRDIPRLTGGSYELVLARSEAAETLAREATAAHADAGNFIRLIYPGREQAERALARAIELRAHVESFTFEQGTLEDLFVKLVSFDESSGAAHG